MKGPNCVKDLFGIQLKFRTYLYALVCDLSKMYHSVYTTETEKHLRRILFRSDSMRKFKTYGPTRVMFGDKPAAAITAEAIKETANIYRYIDEDSAEKIENETYVDDMASGANTIEDIKRMKEKIPEILSKGGFRVKGFVTTGDNTKEALSLLGSGDVGRVLGVSWHPKNDEFSVEVNINISKKYKGARIGNDLKIEEIPCLIEMKLTRRILLGVTN